LEKIALGSIFLPSKKKTKKYILFSGIFMNIQLICNYKHTKIYKICYIPETKLQDIYFEFVE